MKKYMPTILLLGAAAVLLADGFETNHGGALLDRGRGIVESRRTDRAGMVDVMSDANGTVTETLNAAQVAERKHKLKLFAGASGALGAACLLLIVVEFIQRGMA